MKRIFLLLVSIFAATAAVAQSSGDYRIRPGDTLRIEVLEDSSLNRNALVLPDGRISFPFAGSVTVGGRTTGQVAGAIASGIASNFAAAPNVYVSVAAVGERQVSSVSKAAPTIRVYMMGEVAGPGLKEMAPGTTILQALAMSGGFTKFAATKRVQLRRQDPASGADAVYKINYKALASGATLKGNIVLSDGDVILVPERRLFE